MIEDKENDKSFSFVSRWIKAFNRMFKLFGKRDIDNNAEFVDAILKDEQSEASTKEELAMIDEKRKLMEELCEDVDIYYEKKASAEMAADLDEWFKSEVTTFVQDTIPDVNQDDIKEIEDAVSDSMAEEIVMRAKMLESEFTDDESDYKKDSPKKTNEDE